MAINNFKPGGGKFASGNKFKGRASAGSDSATNRSSRDARSDREPRSYNADRPAREGKGDRPDRAGKFGDKKVFNRSERFTRSGEEGAPRPAGERPRAFDKSSFKSGPKFSKPSPYQGDKRGDARPSHDRPGFNRDQDARGERRERPGREERTPRSDDSRGADRPRYGDRKQAEGGYAARGERKPYGAKPYQESFGGEERRTAKPAYDKPRFDKSGQDKPRFDKPAYDKPRFDKSGQDKPRFDKPAYDKPRFDKPRGEADDHAGENREKTPARPYTPSRTEGFDRPRPGQHRAAGERKPYERAKPAADRGTGREDKRSFRSKAEEGEAPSYDLKRYQARESRHTEKDIDNGLIRLNRYIANAGICSRREADTLIAAGEIKVNGEVITEMGYTVKPEDTVTYGKKRLNREKMVYVLLNKPKDFITTTEDPEGRKTVMDLVGKASKERIFPVGRLDRNTTGLLLFTNDGELAHKLTHPSNNISKIYQVELDKPITRDHFEQIVNGLELEDGKAEVDDLAIIGDSNTFLGIQIHIGKNRIVRRIFEHLGYEVVSLDRVQYAGLTKKDLTRGHWRFLNEKEVIRLKYFL
jgi:23S rRNA pseudouridine2605 synthase